MTGDAKLMGGRGHRVGQRNANQLAARSPYGEAQQRRGTRISIPTIRDEITLSLFRICTDHNRIDVLAKAGENVPKQRRCVWEELLTRDHWQDRQRAVSRLTRDGRFAEIALPFAGMLAYAWMAFRRT